MTTLSPLGSAIAGGALIGLAAGLYALVNGRVAGISGMLGSLLPGGAAPRRDGALFLLGLLAAPLVWRLGGTWPIAHFDSGGATLIVAGLLVGIGTRLGSGCTSGHGICGLSRLSGRSLIAVSTFMFAGFITVAAVRHLFGGGS